jgi:adenylate cyclase
MAVEIERKFLVTSNAWQAGATGTAYRQGYLVAGREMTVRVREGGGRAYLTLKAAGDTLARAEFEYEIPVADAAFMFQKLCTSPLIEKTRYEVPFAGHSWEIDVFHGANDGLIIAEVELDREDEAVDLPPWVGREVTGDSRYYNACLTKSPYREWKSGPA